MEDGALSGLCRFNHHRNRLKFQEFLKCRLLMTYTVMNAVVNNDVVDDHALCVWIGFQGLLFLSSTFFIILHLRSS